MYGNILSIKNLDEHSNDNVEGENIFVDNEESSSADSDLNDSDSE